MSMKMNDLIKQPVESQSIIAKAFRGELIPQDPNDEPAQKLLQRIKSLKEAKQ
jgi:type I restriction enzyme S subunit